MAKRKESLASAFPKLIEEWHPEKNGTLLPSDVSPFSHRKCWWLCPRGHDYLAIVEHRARGSGCPYCSNHKVWSGFNDFATLRPDLLCEWNWEKNSDVSPSEIAEHSSKFVWWKCQYGHEYQMTPASKVGNGYGCPVCTGKRVQVGVNDLASQRHDLVKEWDVAKNAGLCPQDVTCGSGKKVWWKCQHEHSWLMSVKNRALQSQGCPYCAGKKAWQGFNDFATYHPELVRYWDFVKNGECTPESVTYGCAKRVWWICDKGHSYDMPVAQKHNGYGCPICSSARITEDNNFAALHPELLAEWDFKKNTISPDKISSYNKSKVWWICPRGHSYQMSPGDRVEGHGCGFCNQTRRTSFFEQAIAFYLKKSFCVEQRIKKNRKEIDIYLPDLNVGIEYDGMFYHAGKLAQEREARKNAALSAAGIRLIRIKETKDKECVVGDVIYHKANFKFMGVSYVMTHIGEFLSKICGRLISFDVNLARDKGTIIQSYEVDREEESLEKLFPYVAAKWDYSKNGGALPRMFTAKSGHRAWWKCPTCGNEWYGPIEHQTNGKCAHNNRCPRCIRAKNLAGLASGYSLKTLHPEIAQEWDESRNEGLRADMVTPGSKRVVWWRCSQCGKSWKSSIKARVINGQCGCRACRKKRCAKTPSITETGSYL